MNKQKDWEKEFDENYPELLASWGNGDVTQNIKQFIKEKIQLAVKEERERILGIIESMYTFKYYYNHHSETKIELVEKNKLINQITKVEE